MIKKFILSLTLLITSGFLFAQSPLKFSDEVQKFPKTDEGPVLEFSYPFTNTSDSPLIINETKVTCSCTKVTFPKEPIPPNGENKIHVTFDTKGKIGFQERTIEIRTNQGNSKIVFKGVVKASKETREVHKTGH